MKNGMRARTLFPPKQKFEPQAQTEIIEAAERKTTANFETKSVSLYIEQKTTRAATMVPSKSFRFVQRLVDGISRHRLGLSFLRPYWGSLSLLETVFEFE
jgi:hypothetical protein